ncbi:MAG: sulfotransferase domain-containing protein, partial [Blastocatellia bacterium]|nr:sulfotransferase domain-containing protein [Blastocatellia bacterium]
KCGTTSLYHYLIAHPNIASPAEKQMHFFDNNFNKGLTWYRTHFPSSLYKFYVKEVQRQPFQTGEGTPYYIFHPLAPERIAKYLPNAKFILLLRNPVDRAYSHYNHEIRKGTEKLSFEEALDKEPERLEGEIEKMRRDLNYYSFSHQHHTYLSRGVYIDQLLHWTKYFPLEQFLVIKSEDFFEKPPLVVAEIIKFLKLPSWQLEDTNNYNKGSYSKMEPKIKSRLVDYFRPHNQKLYEFLGRDFGWDR